MSVVLFSDDARKKLIEGVNILGNAVKATIGPKGKNAIIKKEFGPPLITNDGVTIAKEILLEDDVCNMGVQLVREAAIKTNDIAGDGTTTSTVLAQALINAGIESCYIKEKENNTDNYELSSWFNTNECSPVLYKQGMEEACKIAVEYLKELAIPVKNIDAIRNVATISSCNEEIGNLIAEATEKVGKTGSITTVDSNTTETTLEIQRGLSIDSGFYSYAFAEDQENIISELNDAYVLVTDQKIRSQKEILFLLEQVFAANKPLVIIAEDFEPIIVTTLLRNNINGLRSVLIKAPSLGMKRKEILEDLACYTGATFIDGTQITITEATLEHCGQVSTAKIGKNTSCFIDSPKAKAEEIETRLNYIVNCIKNCKSEYEKEKLKERLAKLTGGIATIKIGAATEPELKEKKLRVEDAINATKAAIEEGIVPGGGTALFNLSPIILEKTKHLKGDKLKGAVDVALAVNAPLIQIATNSCKDPNYIMAKILNDSKEQNNKNIGYDALNDKFVDMIEEGIIDPVKVTKNALINAVSVAGVFLTTEVTIL